METLISKLQIPLYIIAVLLLIIAAAYVMGAYKDYWQGNLAKKQYLKD
jgi:hypothetical protein